MTEEAGERNTALKRIFNDLEDLEGGIRKLNELRASCVNQEEIDRLLLKKIGKLQKEKEDTRKSLESCPLLLATVLQTIPGSETGTRCLVRFENRRAVVGVHPDVSSVLGCGDQVVLDAAGRIILAKLDQEAQPHGQVAIFDRRVSDKDGRVVVKWLDQEHMAWPSAELSVSQLRQGDRVLWCQDIGIAFKRIEDSKDHEMFLTESPKQKFEDIGGLTEQIDTLKMVISLNSAKSSLVEKYRIRRPKGILLEGPPGNGKTMLARALASHMAEERSSGESRFLYIKPGQLYSMWFGQSEQRIREIFRVARNVAKSQNNLPVVMFFDEIDSMGALRAQSLNKVYDRVIQAFMSELDGFETLENVLIVAATNRQDVLDPALTRPGRLGDIVINIPRPARDAAKDIFFKHLPDTVPFSSTKGVESAKMEIIENALEDVFSDGESNMLGIVEFPGSDRKPMFLRKSHLVSGAVIANICDIARQKAFLRATQGEDEGIRKEDVLTAISGGFAASRSHLTSGNIAEYLPDLFPHGNAEGAVLVKSES